MQVLSCCRAALLPLMFQGWKVIKNRWNHNSTKAFYCSELGKVSDHCLFVSQIKVLPVCQCSRQFLNKIWCYIFRNGQRQMFCYSYCDVWEFTWGFAVGSLFLIKSINNFVLSEDCLELKFPKLPHVSEVPSASFIMVSQGIQHLMFTYDKHIQLLI